MKKKDIVLSFKVNKEIYKKLKKVIEKESRSISNFLQITLKEKLEQYE